MISRIRQWLCRHQWRVCRFQSLTPGTDIECTKCGKQEKHYHGYWSKGAPND